MPRTSVTLAALVLLALASPGCLWSRGTPEEPIVSRLELRGVKRFDPDEVAAVLATRGPEAQLFPPRKIGYRLDPDALAVDARRVEAWYRDRGYFGAKVGGVEVVPDGAGRAKVVMTVKEGDPVKVRSVAMDGLREAPEAMERLGRAPLEVGDVFSVAAYDATRDAILSALKGTGWPTAEVTQRARVLPDEGAVEVTYEVKPGPRLRFGPIFVAGTSAVSRALIRDQATADVKTGEWYDARKLELAQARVFALGVFSGVRVTTGAPTPGEAAVPVVIAVREAPFRTLRLGPSIGIETTRWEARGVAGWTHRNFGGDLRRVSVDGRVGYAWLPTALSAARNPNADGVRVGWVGELALEYAQPAAFTRYVDTSAKLDVEKGIELAYRFWAQRLQLGLPLRFSPRWTLVPSYNVEVYELSDVPSGDSTSQRPVLENCPNTVCLLSYLEQRIAFDHRDSPVETRSGFYAAIAVQEGVNLGGYGYRYLRVLPELRGFVPLGPRTVVAGRARGGALVPVNENGNPPIVARFFAGGPSSNRGFTTRGLSPMENGVPIGGNGLLEGSLELRQGLLGALSGVLFTDVGRVLGSGGAPSAYQEVLDVSRLELAVGGGLRYATPFGPVRLDVGLRPRRFTEVHGFRSLFGGQFPGAVHISIGEAF
ncbi:MAG: BamA/TamA family outer membrane protein [Anaeromyxobacteraceae bacterium]